MDANETKVAFGVLAIEVFKRLNLGVFLGVGPHHPNACKVFLRAHRDLSKEFLDLFETNMHLLAKNFYSQRNKRHRDKEQKCKSPVEHEHQWQDKDHDKNCLQRVHDHRTSQLSYCRQVVRGAGHQIAGAMLVKE